MPTNTKQTSVLLILDGWGYRKEQASNAIALAHTPNWDRIVKDYPNTKIETSGQAVGLPDGQMGNSEVGHMNIGAGRVIYQNFTRINGAIADGTFASNQQLCDAIKGTDSRGAAMHIMGLLSPGGVHSHEEHFKEVFRVARNKGVESIYFHLFLDGRDTPPRSALSSLKSMEDSIQELGCGKIASICGRYHSMDRDKRWDRTADTYRLVMNGMAKHRYASAIQALEAAYEVRDEDDEFIQPTVICEDGTDPATVLPDDTILFMNFRPDRARQLTSAFIDPNLGFDWQTHVHPKENFYTLTSYADNLNTRVLFPPVSIENSLGEYLSSLGKTQLRISETEKYAHVTYFFNGGKEEAFEGEDRILVPSPDVPTYDLKPEMSAHEVTDKLVAAINSRKYDVIVCNYANGDMVGHSGNFDAAIKAVEVVDSCLEKVVSTIEKNGDNCIITADHGNVEQMKDLHTGAPHTAHTNLPVPLVLISKDQHILNRTQGKLADITPTLLELMKLDQPKEISGASLLF